MIEEMTSYLEETFKRYNPEVYIEILEQDRENFAKEISDLQQKIDKTIEILKDTSVDMPSTLLIETIDYARYILGEKENE